MRGSRGVEAIRGGLRLAILSCTVVVVVRAGIDLQRLAFLRNRLD